MTQLSNRTLFTGDNLPVLRRMDNASVDLIYLDPPFNSNRTYSAPIGSEAAGAAFKDSWELSDVDLAWHGEIAEREPALYEIVGAAGRAHSKGMQAYLIMMAVRLLEMRRILRPTGSVYLHCDPTASHYLKTLMDAIWGKDQFRNEIVWSYKRWPSKQRNFQSMHDVILRYSAGGEWTWNQQYEPPSASYVKRFKGKTQVLDPESKTRKLVIDKPTKGLPMRDSWDISILAGSSKERCGYPTQKPLTLLERIIQSSSNPSDVILDPFCGCATTLVAAEKLDRHWIGIDLSDMAVRLVKSRMERELGGLICKVVHRTDIPERTDQGPLPDYRTHKHTLYGRQEGRCEGCRIYFPYPNLTVDHVQPRSQGGTHHMSNLQLLCGACNSIKGTGTMADLRARLERRDGTGPK